MKPSSRQFFEFVERKISEGSQQSAAWKAVLQLFQAAESLYRTLDFHTSNSLAVFKGANTYLTPTQEHDLVALTAQYVVSLNTAQIRQIVDQDTAIADEERAVLRAALDLYKASAESACAALGNPRWVE